MTKLVRLAECMTRYQCNLKGCCCSGWGVTFEPEELPPLLEVLSEEEGQATLEGIRFFVDEDNNVTRWSLQPAGDEACQMLQEDGACGIHKRFGPDVLPHLCRSFPVFAKPARGPDEPIELHYDAICPEVLARLVREEGPLELVDVEAPDGSDLAARASRTTDAWDVTIGDRAISPAQLHIMRSHILDTWRASFDSDEPALDTLGRVNVGLALLARDQTMSPDDFRVPDADEVDFDGFYGYVHQCIALHDQRALAGLMFRYRRFVHHMEISDAQWDEIDQDPRHFAYDPLWNEYFDVLDPQWQGVLRRYLSHRYYNAHDRSPAANRFAFTYGTVVHCFGTVCRMAAAVGKWLDRPVDLDLLTLAIGATEYMYRVLRMPVLAMPWYGFTLVPHQADKKSDQP